MKLGVFTPVFGGMSIDAMLAKVRALEKVQAIEIGTGGWPGNDHLDLDALLDNKVRACEYRRDDRGRRPDDQRAVVPWQPAAPGPRHRAPPTMRLFRKTVRLAEQTGRAGGRDVFRLPRRLRRGEASELGHPAVAAGISRRARMAVGEEGHSVLEGRRAVRRRARRQRRARSAPRLRRLQRRHSDAAARGGGAEPRRQLRSEPFLLAGRGRADGDPGARRRDLPRPRQGRRARPRRTSR